MKIDVQGHDLEVLKGAKQTILKYKMPIIVEYEKFFENKYKYNFLDFSNFAEEIDYQMSKLNEDNYLLTPHKK